MAIASDEQTSAKRTNGDDDDTDDDDTDDTDDTDDDTDDDDVVFLDARDFLAESASPAVRVTLESIARRARETDTEFDDVLASIRIVQRRRALDAFAEIRRRENGRVVLVRPHTIPDNEHDVGAQRRRADARLDARDAGDVAIENWEPTHVDDSTVARFERWARFVDDKDATAFVDRAVELFGVEVERERDRVHREASFIDAWREARRRRERDARLAREGESNRRRARDKSPLGSPSRMK
tara:strand:- start:7142 stop:7861 length:720 start_codon:yes stop_codon:yes gene_type:complete